MESQEQNATSRPISKKVLQSNSRVRHVRRYTSRLDRRLVDGGERALHRGSPNGTLTALRWEHGPLQDAVGASLSAAVGAGVAELF